MKADAGIGIQIDSRIISTIDLLYDHAGQPDLVTELKFLEATHALSQKSEDDAASMFAYLAS